MGIHCLVNGFAQASKLQQNAPSALYGVRSCPIYQKNRCSRFPQRGNAMGWLTTAQSYQPRSAIRETEPWRVTALEAVIFVLTYQLYRHSKERLSCPPAAAFVYWLFPVSRPKSASMSHPPVNKVHTVSVGCNGACREGRGP